MACEWPKEDAETVAELEQALNALQYRLILALTSGYKEIMKLSGELEESFGRIG